MPTEKELEKKYAKALISRGISPDMELGGKIVEFESDPDPRAHINVFEMAGLNSKIDPKELDKRYELINELFNSTDK